jgi:hypothetical protein
MTEHKDPIKDLFKAGLEYYQASPPPHIWLGIVQRKKQRKMLVWKWSAAAAVALLLLSLGTWVAVDQTKNTYLSDKADKADTVSEKNAGIKTKMPPKTTAIAQVELPHGPTNEPDRRITPNQNSIDRVSVVIYAALSQKRLTALTVDPFASLPNMQSRQITKPEETAGLTLINAAKNEQLSKYLAELEELSDIRVDLSQSRNTENKWNLGMAYGTTPNYSIPAEDFTLAPERATFGVSNFTNDIGEETAYYSQIESTLHRSPLSFGLLAGLPLGKRLQFESGLIYTRLSTISQTYVMNGWQNVYESNLHYMGIPAGLRFEFLQRNLFSLFVSQAAIFEKGIRASNTTINYQDGLLISSENTFDKVNGFQLSSLSSIGTNITITKQFSLYAQAGIQFFFLNEKQPYNIRSNRTAWPSMQTGLRYQFK